MIIIGEKLNSSIPKGIPFSSIGKQNIKNATSAFFKLSAKTKGRHNNYTKGVNVLNNKIEIRLIVYGSEEYKRELELRDEVLRKPIGLSIFDNNLEKEAKDYHIGVFENDTIVGILILTDINKDETKMRQVAVDELFRGKYIGTKLTIFAEDLAKRLGYKRIILKARKTAVEFYEKLGYLIEGDEFLEVGIPHFSMHKTLD